MGCYSVAHSPGPPPLSQALLAGLVYSRERSRQDGQSPCDLAGQAGNTRQVNLGPPGNEHTHGGVRWLGGLDQIIHTDGFAWGSVQDAVYLASEGTLVCRALCWGPGTCDTHSWARKMLGQGGWQSPPAHQQVRQKQHLLVVGLLCLPTPCPGRRDAEPLPEPRDWAPGGTLLGRDDVSVAAVSWPSVAGKEDLAPISQLWKLRPRGMIRELTQRPQVQGLGRRLSPPSLDHPREPGAVRDGQASPLRGKELFPTCLFIAGLRIVGECGLR